MLEIKQGTQIEKLGFDEYAYKVKFKNSPVWSIYVSRIDGAVTFLKSGILPESVEKFEARRNGRNTEIYLHTKGAADGSRVYYSGDIVDHTAAENWVSVVNKIHEKRRNNQELTRE